MNYDRIRSMNDKELAQFLRDLSNRDTTKCSKCGQIPKYVVKIENTETFQTKKLCAICDECYKQLLMELNTFEILWK